MNGNGSFLAQMASMMVVVMAIVGATAWMTKQIGDVTMELSHIRVAVEDLVTKPQFSLWVAELKIANRDLEVPHLYERNQQDNHSPQR